MQAVNRREGICRGAVLREVANVRPYLSRESLGVGPDFPGIAPNPLLSSDARKRNTELRTGALALGVLIDWRKLNSNPAWS